MLIKGHFQESYLRVLSSTSCILYHVVSRQASLHREMRVHGNVLKLGKYQVNIKMNKIATVFRVLVQVIHGYLSVAAPDPLLSHLCLLAGRPD